MTIAYLPSRADARPETGGSRIRVDGDSRGRGASRRTTVTVCGEVDAANAKEFAVAVCAAIPGNPGAVAVDLSGLGFIAVDGIAALHAINAHLARGGWAWHVVPSAAVLRVLDLCDPVGLIPRVLDDSARDAIA